MNYLISHLARAREDIRTSRTNSRSVERTTGPPRVSIRHPGGPGRVSMFLFRHRAYCRSHTTGRFGSSSRVVSKREGAISLCPPRRVLDAAQIVAGRRTRMRVSASRGHGRRREEPRYFDPPSLTVSPRRAAFAWYHVADRPRKAIMGSLHRACDQLERAKADRIHGVAASVLAAHLARRCRITIHQGEHMGDK